jgi:hypothetical protein
VIVHDSITLVSADAPVVFAELAGVSCSICAPETMTMEQIEAYANEHGPRTNFGLWVAVDKSKIAGFGGPTPNPCNQVAGRKHWFLLNEPNAAALFGEMRR